MDLDFSVLGWGHALAATLAMLAGAWALLRPKGTARHKLVGRVYAGALAITCVSALGVYNAGRWFFPHTLAVITLALLALGVLAARIQRPHGAWIHVHLNSMILSYYMLVGGAVNEAFLHIHALQAPGPNPLATPALGITHSVVILVFVIWLAAANAATFTQERLARRSPAAAPA